MADERAQYESQTVRTIRATEARTIAKWEGAGWELVSRTPGRVRTEITFRRPKPKTARDHLASAWTAFRNLTPAAQRGVLAATGTLIAIVIVGGTIAAIHGGAEAQPVALQTQTVVAPTPSEVSPATPTPEITSDPPGPASEAVLTVHNNKDLEALLAVDNPDDASVADFAVNYEGRTIAFNGNFADLQPHGDYETRFDILMSPGNFSEDDSTGPNFQFSDVSISDLHLTGSDIPDSIGGGDNVRVIAQVGEYNSDTQLFQLTPVSTRLR